MIMVEQQLHTATSLLIDVQGVFSFLVVELWGIDFLRLMLSHIHMGLMRRFGQRSSKIYVVNLLYCGFYLKEIIVHTVYTTDIENRCL